MPLTVKSPVFEKQDHEARPVIVLGVDASRCRSGGSHAHLAGVLGNVNPADYGISRVHVWSNNDLLAKLPSRPWLVAHGADWLERSLPWQIAWQGLTLAGELRKHGCTMLFTADASSVCRFDPQVVLSQDLLSYEPDVMRSFSGKRWLRLYLILHLQNLAFRRARGVIFLSQHSATMIQRNCGALARTTLVPHGIEADFLGFEARVDWNVGDLATIECVYVSNAEMYKHQWQVVRAIGILRHSGLQVRVTLVGGGAGEAQRLTEEAMREVDPEGEFVTQTPFLPRRELPGRLQASHVFIFASSCETFGIALLEGMAVGLPVACSNRSSLPEVLGDAGEYFDPAVPASIARAVRTLIEDRPRRVALARKAKERARGFTWKRCAEGTFQFISDTYRSTLAERR